MIHSKKHPRTIITPLVMALACVVFIALGAKSFRDARKAREAA